MLFLDQVILFKLFKSKHAKFHDRPLQIQSSMNAMIRSIRVSQQENYEN